MLEPSNASGLGLLLLNQSDKTLDSQDQSKDNQHDAEEDLGISAPISAALHNGANLHFGIQEQSSFRFTVCQIQIKSKRPHGINLPWDRLCVFSQLFA